MEQLKVAIIGAGVGGLCLAQGLKCAGLAVEVFERDASPTSSVAGYRLSISPTGSRALKACLPDAVFERLTQLASAPSRSVTFFDHRLNRLLALDLPNIDRRQLDAERPIGRGVCVAYCCRGSTMWRVSARSSYPSRTARTDG